MKILFLTTEDSTFWSHRLALALAAKAEGADVVVMTRSGRYCSLLEGAGLRIIRWNISRPSLNPFRELYSLFQVFRAYQCERPDLVHHVALKPIIYGGIAAHLVGSTPAINTITGLGLVFTSPSWPLVFLRFMLSLVLKLVCGFPNSRTIVQNEIDRELLLKKNIMQPSRAVVIPGFGVDTGQFAPRPEPMGIPVVMLPARMLWEKGVLEFVSAAKEIREKGISARMVLVGVPDPQNKGCISEACLKEWVRSGAVEWWGKRENMPETLSEANVVCLPSYREGIPKVLMEAAACGRAIVTTNAPGCSYVVRNGENGFLVPVKDSRALAAAISVLLQSPSLRKQMGAAGRKRAVLEFSEEQVISQTLHTYTEVLNRKWQKSDRPFPQKQEEREAVAQI
jgi:glycosyltransferase involved in cell wall biosynthesis